MSENNDWFPLYDKDGNFKGAINKLVVQDLAEQGVELIDGSGSYEQVEPSLHELEEQWSETLFGDNYLERLQEAQEPRVYHDEEALKKWDAFCKKSMENTHGRKM